MRAKLPNTGRAGVTSVRTNRIRSAQNALDTDPLFRYDFSDIADTMGPDTNGGKQIWVRGYRSCGQDSGIVIPFRTKAADNTLTVNQLTIHDDWLLDLSTTGIDEANRIGGRIDGDRDRGPQ